jgi:TPR repeat protein
MLYMTGQGVGPDFKEADRWFRKAAAQGDAGAQNMSELISQSDLAAILVGLASKGVIPSDATSASQCSFCSRGCESGLKLKPCSRCKVVFYCGEECQRKHWKEGHKAVCTSK